MMKKIIKPLLIATAMFMLSGCGMSNLNYNNKQLTLQVEQGVFQTNGTLLNAQISNFSTLLINQKIIRLDEGNIVVYEDARTDLLYQFDPTTTRSIKVIFEARKVIRVYSKNLLFAYQLILKDGRILNVIAQQDDNQYLRILYGMSTTQLNKMLKQVDPDAREAYYKQVIIIQDEQHAIFSKWDVRKIHFYPLVVPLRRLMGGG